MPMTATEQEIMRRLATVDDMLMNVHHNLSFYTTDPPLRTQALIVLTAERASWSALDDVYRSKVMPTVAAALRAVAPIISRVRNLVREHKETAARDKIVAGRQRFADLYEAAVMDTQ